MFFLLANPLPAQVPIRGSLTGYEAAARRVGSISEMPYNLLLGPVRVKLAASLDLEANDNITLADETGPSKKLSDVILRPRVEVIGAWQVTPLNRLDIRLGLGVERHINHPDHDSSSLIAEPSEINFDVYIRNLRLSLHDRFSLQQDPLSDPSISNSGQTGYFTNTLGVTALWDLNRIIVTAGFDYTTQITTGTTDQSQNRNSELFYASLGFPLDTTTLGLQGSVAISSYQLALQPDLTVVSFGPFVQALLTPYTHVDLSGGIQYSSFQARQSGIDFGASAARTKQEQSASAPGFHFTCSITNRLNSSIRQTLSFGHERELAFGANYVDRNFANYTMSWHLTPSIYLNLVVFYENGTAAGDTRSEKFTRYGLSTSFSYLLTRHLSVALRYSYTRKSSDLEFRNYMQNVLGITFSYDF